MPRFKLINTDNQPIFVIQGNGQPDKGVAVGEYATIETPNDRAVLQVSSATDYPKFLAELEEQTPAAPVYPVTETTGESITPVAPVTEPAETTNTPTA